MTIRYESELCHYGVQGMKWGVRRSQEVRSVNKQYKKDLKVLQKERRKANIKANVKGNLAGMLVGAEGAQRSIAYQKGANNQVYKDKKKVLQEKYEPDFKKAQNKAEKRIASEQAINKTKVSNMKISKGKKVAAGVLAGLGTVLVTDTIVNKAQNKQMMDHVKMLLAAKKL